MRNSNQALYYNVYTSLMGDPNLYFTTLLVIVVALLPDVLIQVPHHTFHQAGPNNVEYSKMILVQVWSSSKIRMKPKANKTMPFIDPVT